MAPPEAAFTPTGYRVFAESRPLVAVGGDFYEMSQRPGIATVVIGDVSGHGEKASRLMLPTAERCRSLASDGYEPSDLLHAINGHCCSSFPDHMFTTLACVALEPARRRIRVANAGHVVPIIRRASGDVVLLGEASGPPLGISKDYRYREQEFELLETDILLLLTDGIVEALEHDLEEMSVLRAAIGASSHRADEIASHLLERADTSPRSVADDVTIVAMERVTHSLRVSAARPRDPRE
jgi:serine phosphatase RsbU (regulator of sigma subunit)